MKNPKCKLYITGCDDSLMWYSDRVGDFVNYMYSEETSDGEIHWSRETGFLNYVNDKDCIFVIFHHHPLKLYGDS
jgi:hypothetical protein